jgi:hypothetical protein
VDQYRKGRVISLVGFAVMGGLFLLGLLGVGISTLSNPGDNTIRYAIMGALGVAVLLIGGSAINFYLRSRELISGKISQVEGPAEPRKYTGDEYGTAYQIKIRKKRFPLKSEQEHDAFEADADYRIY